jgi:hypothetical protein
MYQLPAPVAKVARTLKDSKLSTCKPSNQSRFDGFLAALSFSVFVALKLQSFAADRE